MRRTSEGVELADAAERPGTHRSWLAWFSGAHLRDVQDAISALEPLVTEARRVRLRQVIGRRLESVTVALDSPYDPHNGAAVLRSCEAFGVLELQVLERKGFPFAIARSVSRGAEKWVDVRRHADADAFLAWAAHTRFPLVATHPDGEMNPEGLSQMPRLTLVLGNEREGIREEVARACCARVRVPMRGFIESLNVSVTAAILLHAATQGRAGDLEHDAKRRLYARGLYLSVPHAVDVLAAAGRQ